MAVDFEGLVTVPGVSTFGETVTYTPSGGDAFTITGIFSESAVVIEEGNEAGVTSRQITLDVVLADFPAGVVPNNNGDEVNARGMDHTVEDVQKEGAGAAKLFLHEIT